MLRRLLQRSPTLTRLAGAKHSHAVISSLRAARVVTPAPRFITGQLTRRNSVGRYAIRDTASVVHLRHATRDVDILNEIFGSTGGTLAYEPPELLRNKLEAKPIQVLDFGANIGLFAVFAFQRWDVRGLISYEPDPENASLLRSTMAANSRRWAWTVEEVAVSNRNGQLRFIPGLFSEGRAADPDEQAIEVPLTDVFALGHDVDLMKIDIEGGEWAILTDPRFQQICADTITLEWHSRSCPADDPHECAVRLLDGAGFDVVQDSPAAHGGNGTLWAARREPAPAPVT
jgi:FkbM family methyltransferase